MSWLAFDSFELNVDAGELRKNGIALKLQPQPLKVLALLAASGGRLVSREEIRKEVWHEETFVDFEQGLNYCIRQIRVALGDDAIAPRFIETVPRRGYRFVAPVRAVVPEPSGAPRRVMLAVLPFTNVSGEDDQEYFSDGLTDEMIAQLGRLNPERLGVIARTSVMTYKRVTRPITAIGRDLGVECVLEGSVRRSGSRVRVTAQLIQVRDQAQRWAATYDRNLDDILTLQTELAQAIAAEIRVQLTPEAHGRLAAPQPVDSGAYDAYLKGRYLWNRRTRDSLEKSIEHFNRTLEINPGYAPAYAGLADVYLTQLDYNYRSPHDAFALANRVLLQALSLDEALAEAHTSLGHLRLHEYQWTAAEHQFKRAIALNPGYSTAHYYYGNLLAALGRWDEAFEEARRARDLDPLAPNTRQNQLFIHYLARQYDAALRQVSETLALDPSYTAINYYAGLIYERLGHFDDALSCFNALGPEGSRGSTVLAALGYVYARAGRREDAARIIERLETGSRASYVSQYDLALIYLAAGNRDKAFSLLDEAFEHHSSFLPFVAVDARLDEMRSDERYGDLLRRLNLTSA